jgi:hypothetical protein
MLSFLRFLALTLMFIFIYRVIVGAFRYISGDDKKPSRPETRSGEEPKKPEQSTYRDVKDAEFKDLPPDSTKPS